MAFGDGYGEVIILIVEVYWAGYGVDGGNNWFRVCYFVGGNGGVFIEIGKG